jgi:hypothetical protein
VELGDGRDDQLRGLWRLILAAKYRLSFVALAFSHAHSKLFPFSSERRGVIANLLSLRVRQRRIAFVAPLCCSSDGISFA